MGKNKTKNETVKNEVIAKIEEVIAEIEKENFEGEKMENVAMNVTENEVITENEVTPDKAIELSKEEKRDFEKIGITGRLEEKSLNQSKES